MNVGRLALLDFREGESAVLRRLRATLGKTQIDANRVLALVEDPAEVLGYLDQSLETHEIHVFADHPAPSFPMNHTWGFGWRCGLKLEVEWLAAAIREGRASSITWHQLGEKIGHSVDIGSGRVTECQITIGDVLVDHSFNVIVCHRNQKQLTRLRDAVTPGPECKIRLWHGSPRGELTSLLPFNQRLWLSQSDGFACCFAARPYSNCGYYQGVDRVHAEVPSIYLVVPSDQSQVLSQPCTLYQVSLRAGDIKEVGIAGFEYVTHRATEAEATTNFRSCGAAFEELGVEVVRLDTASAHDPSLAERCRAYRHSIEAFLRMPLDVGVCVRSKQWALQLWLRARGLDETTTKDGLWLRQFAERGIMPMISRCSQLPEFGYHSLFHLMQVGLLAALIAIRENGNPIAAMFAGLIHDAAREGDEGGVKHAELAVSVLDAILRSELRYLLAPQEWERVRYAVVRHAFGETSTDPVVGACWDADRLRIAWERGVRDRFFSTRTGLMYAHSGDLATHAFATEVFGPSYF